MRVPIVLDTIREGLVRTFSNIVQLVALVFLDTPREDEPTRPHTRHSKDRLCEIISGRIKFARRRRGEKIGEVRRQRESGGMKIENYSNSSNDVSQRSFHRRRTIILLGNHVSFLHKLIILFNRLVFSF